MKQELQGETKKGRRSLEILAYVVLIFAIVVFCYAAFQLFSIYREYKKGSDEYQELREYVEVIQPEKSKSDGNKDSVLAEEFPQCPISVDLQALKNINQDTVGWIYIEAIPSISYPVVQGTDNDYYLTHTVEGVKNTSASIFLDYRNASDLNDSNSIIYGHNMKNQSMFGLLKRLKEQDVYDQSPYIWLITEAGEICYEIFSARNVPDIDILYNTLQAEPDSYKATLEEYQCYSEIKTDVTFDGTERILTLSTCTSDESFRCVVQAVRRDF